MSVTVLAMITIAEGEAAALARYLAVTDPILEKVGAKITQRFDINDVVVGRSTAKSIVVVQYPSKEAVHAVFSSKEYEDLVPIRDRAFHSYSISIVENAHCAP